MEILLIIAPIIIIFIFYKLIIEHIDTRFDELKELLQNNESEK